MTKTLEQYIAETEKEFDNIFSHDWLCGFVQWQKEGNGVNGFILAFGYQMRDGID